MATTALEEFDSRGWQVGDNTTHTLTYMVYDADDSDEAYTQVLADSPGAWYGYWRQGMTGQALGGDCWKVTVKYGSKQIPEDTDDKDDPVASLEINVTTRGGSAHIDSSLQTVSKYPRDANQEVDYHQLLNVLNDGERVEIRGTDIIVPQLEFNVTRYFSRWDVHPTYLKKLYELTGKSNDAPFYGMATGEVLFMGADLQTEGVDLVRATFYFGAQPNETSLTVDGITGIDKKGWEYAWYVFKEKTSGYLGKVMRITQVNIEKVYEAGDFEDLDVYLHNCYGYFRWNGTIWELKDETQCTATPTTPAGSGDWSGQVRTVSCTCGVS